MCNNPTCGPCYPLEPVVKSTAVADAPPYCQITVPDFTVNFAGNVFVLEVDQPIPVSTAAVSVDYGRGVLALMDRWGNTVHADQLVKAIALREKEKCATCPCAVAQFRVRVCYDPARFAVLCDLPRSAYCGAGIAQAVSAEADE